MPDDLSALDAFDSLLEQPASKERPIDLHFIPWIEWQMQMIDKAIREGKAAFRRRQDTEARKAMQSIARGPENASNVEADALFEKAESKGELDFWN